MKKIVALGISILIFFSSILVPVIVLITITTSNSSKANTIDEIMVGLPEMITPEMVIASIEAQEKYGVYTSVTLAQIVQESSGNFNGSNMSQLAYECHNLFGMKGEGPAGYKEYQTLEYGSDGAYYVKAKFRKYNNVGESIEDHAKLLSSGRYLKYTASAKTADEYAVAIYKAGYATDPSYAKNLISLMKKYDLYMFDNMSVKDAENYLKGDGNATGKYIWPLPAGGTITCYFGYRGDIGVEGATDYHPAIDIAIAGGTTVYASDGGVVIHAGEYGTGGNAIIIKHKEGTETHYYHLRNQDGIMVKEGQKVSRGQKIGRVGSTGASSGNHLHFGIKENGEFIDPLTKVKQK